jgi:N-acetylglutamate synthase-like GNAT family acetyltransferase
VYIRQATLGDQRAIRSLVREAGLNPLRLHWRNFVVACDAESVVACGQVRPHRNGSAEMASLAVTPAYQGRGIGKELVRTLIRRGRPQLFLMCDAKMRRYYAAFGFSVVGAGQLPPEMQALFRLGSIFAWTVRTLTCRPVRVLAMRRQSGHSPLE